MLVYDLFDRRWKILGDGNQITFGLSDRALNPMLGSKLLGKVSKSATTTVETLEGVWN